MEQKELWKNITNTVCVLGLATSLMNINNTRVISSVSGSFAGNYGSMDIQTYNSTGNIAYAEANNVDHKKRENKLMTEAEALFGQMREATPEESTSVNKYIKSISKSTGVNFFDLC